MKRTRLGGMFIASLFGICLLACGLESRAEDRRHIEVVGHATLTARPDVARIEARVSATEETSKKALDTFLEKKGEFNTAVSPMNFEGIKVEFDRTNFSLPPTYDQVMFADFEGDVAEVEEPVNQTSVSEVVTVEIPGLEKMEEDQVKRLVAKIYDEIKSSGGVPVPDEANQYGMWAGGQRGDIKYLISKPQSLVEKGQIEAMDDARSKATHLAKLSGGKVGRVISVKEVGPEMGNDGQSLEQAMMEIYGMIGSRDAFSSDAFGDIKIDVKLKVQFELTD